MLFKIKKFEDMTVLKMSKTLLGKPVFFVHAFSIDNLLVDTGFTGARLHVRQFMKEHGVENIAITHHHEDHIGANAEANRLGIVPLVPREGLELIEHPHKLQRYRSLTWGMPEPSEAQVLGSTLQSGRLTFEVLHAPGHSHDHKVFFLKERGWLFSGDVFLSEHLKYMRDDENPVIAIETLRELLKLDFDVMFDALRGPVRKGKTAMKNKLEFLEEKKDRVNTLYAKGIGLRSITHEIFGREGLMTAVSSGHYSKLNFTRALLGITNYPRPT